MKFKIKKGRHHCNWWWIPRLSPIPFGESTWEIKMWGEGLKYDFGHPDQLDINKIFGESYGINHHKNSWRLGWRTETIDDFVRLYHYKRIFKRREGYFIEGLPINSSGVFYKKVVIKKEPDRITLKYVGGEVSTEAYPSKISWLLKPYFGGNRKTTGDIHFEINRVK